MKNIFNSVKMTKPGRNVFDLSHDVKLSCQMGQLVPTCAIECVPGDKFSLSCDSLGRFAPLIAPMMHRVDVYMHYYFVPFRLLWPNWEKFITNSDTVAFPIIQINTANYGRLSDYLGLPDPNGTSVGATMVSAMYHSAYQFIYNEYYRDQNLQEPVPWQLQDGENTANGALYTLRNRCWEHDYFTAALPFAQKGDAVSLPIGVFQDVPVNRNTNPLVVGTTIDPTVGPDLDVEHILTNSPLVDPDELYANTTQLTAEPATINTLRRAYKLQEWLEKAARGGSRLVENILVHFGVKSPDARLQRPEYITGTKSPFIISEVLNTTGTDDAPQGNMAGHGVAVTNGKYGGYFVQEQGIIMGIMSIMPKTAYQQGIPKQYYKFGSPFDYYWPSFAHIGEQEVRNGEIFAYNGDFDAETFGYVPRYAEYKFMPNRVAGEFRSSLDFWHMGRKFDSPPALNSDFVTADPTLRVFAVVDPTTDHIYMHILHKIRAVRPMPKYGTPSF